VPARCLIVDDESPAREELRHLLGGFDDVVVVGEATTAEEAEVLIGSVDYDLVLLDIRMPGMGGLELARTLAAGPTRPAIVFTTAYADHAVEAFDLEAADYLVKPFDADRLRRAVDRALEQRAERGERAERAERAERQGARGSGRGGERGPDPGRGSDVEVADTAVGGGPSAAAPGTGPAAGNGPGPAAASTVPPAVARIPVHKGGRILLVEEPRIAYAEAARGYAYLKLVAPNVGTVQLADDRLLTSYTLHDLEERFSDAFVRTHRSFLVNLRHVREVVPQVGGTLTLVMGDRDRSQVPVARRQASELRRRLGV
jgi:DNA-binding LytR/AlgR family response regulator